MQYNFRIKYLSIIVLLILGYFLLLFSNIFTDHSFCIFKNITGLPCPSCGSTRATLLLLHGEIIDSLLLNPFGIITNLLILFSTGWMIRDIIKNEETFFPFLKTEWDLRIIIVITLVALVNWIWNIKKGL
mgnify:CR=1 FL=1